jgi:tetratricopeptide (TPR) repeat protein
MGASDATQAAIDARRVGLATMRKPHPELADLLERFFHAIEKMDIATAEGLFQSARARARAELLRGDPLWSIWVGAVQDAGYSLWYSPLEARTEPFWLEAYSIQERELGTTSAETAETLAMLAGVLNRSGRAREAEARVRESARVMHSVFGGDHPRTAFAESILAENLISQRRFEEAEPILLAAHRILVAVQDESNFCQMDSLKRMVGMYDAWERPDVAAPYRAELAQHCALAPMLMPYPLLRTLFDADAAAVLAALDRFQALADLGSQGMPAPPQEAQEPADVHETLASLRSESARLWEPTHPTTALLGRMLVLWGSALEGRVRAEDRAEMSADALRLLEPWRSRIPPEELADALALRAATLAAGEHARAVELAREACALVRAPGEELPRGKQTWTSALAWLRVGKTLARLDLADEAEPLLRTAHDTLLAHLGPNQAHSNAARAALHEVYLDLERPVEAAKYAGDE